MRLHIDIVSISAILACLLAGASQAQGPLTSAFTYQGELQSGGNPANGAFDLRFTLFDALAGGAMQGSPIVAAGRFTVSLDFGAQFNGQQRYLKIEVRPDTGADCTSGTGFTVLAPRQQLAGVPNHPNHPRNQQVNQTPDVPF